MTSKAEAINYYDEGPRLPEWDMGLRGLYQFIFSYLSRALS